MSRWDFQLSRATNYPKRSNLFEVGKLFAQENQSSTQLFTGFQQQWWENRSSPSLISAASRGFAFFSSGPDRTGTVQYSTVRTSQCFDVFTAVLVSFIRFAFVVMCRTFRSQLADLGTSCSWSLAPQVAAQLVGAWSDGLIAGRRLGACGDGRFQSVEWGPWGWLCLT